jgi:uncharacterized protein YwqG
MTAISDQVLELIKANHLEQYAETIVSLLKPSIRLRTHPVKDEAELPIGHSKIGGRPDLPDGISWPLANHNPLEFIAQIRLDDVQPYDIEKYLPQSGILYCFYDGLQWLEGEPFKGGRYRVYYLDGGNNALTRTSPPPYTPHPDIRFLLHPACTLSASLEYTLPPFESSVIRRSFGWTWNDLETLGAEIDGYCNLCGQLSAWYPRGVKHRMLGYPDQIQGDIMFEAEQAAKGLSPKEWQHPDFDAVSPDWLLLLQVDSDPGASMMWGDVGNLYYCIKQDSLQKCQFDTVICTMQCT